MRRHGPRKQRLRGADCAWRRESNGFAALSLALRVLSLAFVFIEGRRESHPNTAGNTDETSVPTGSLIVLGGTAVLDAAVLAFERDRNQNASAMLQPWTERRSGSFGLTYSQSL